MCESASAIGTGFSRSARLFRRRVGSALVGLLVTGDYVEHIWWFRKSGTTEVVWSVASGSETRLSWRADSPVRASTCAVSNAADGASERCPSGALLARRLRCDGDAVTRVAATTTRPSIAATGIAIGGFHQSDCVMRRTPPRHPPRGPPKIRQCRSQRRAVERFEAPCDGVARVLTKASGGAAPGSGRLFTANRRQPTPASELGAPQHRGRHSYSARGFSGGYPAFLGSCDSMR